MRSPTSNVADEPREVETMGSLPRSSSNVETEELAAHALPTDAVVAALGTDTTGGLTTSEAQRRLAQAGRNELPPPTSQPWWRRVLRQFGEPMALLLLAAAAISGLALGEHLDAAVIGAIVVLNAVLAVVQEGKAAKALDALQEYETPTAEVRRDGQVKVIPAPEIVPGDLVVLRAGDRIPADVRLVDISFLEVNESLLTGEPLPVGKDPSIESAVEAGLAERVSMAFSGTLVTRGSATGVVTATATNTELGRIAAELREPRSATPLQVELAALTGRLGLLAVAVATGVFVITAARLGWNGDGLQEAFLSAVALAVAAVPEGLATVTTVALALGVQRMARRGAIIRRLPAVETLGSTTALVIDKTGTVTENQLRVEHATMGGGETYRVDELPGQVAGRFRQVAVLCNDATLTPPTGDPIEIALLEAFDDPNDSIIPTYTRLRDVPFDSERRRMTTVHRGTAGLILTMKGAPEAVIRRCTTVLDTAGNLQPLSEGDRERLNRQADELASAGTRTLAFAFSEPPAEPDDLEAAENDLSLVGLIGTRDPVRSGAARSVASIRRAGIGLIMATGDHPGTAAAIAREVGIVDTGSPVMTGRDLRDAIPDQPLRHQVYARLDPDQKLALVEKLQSGGHITAMTGDGVNDAPALRRADIGVALGRSGSAVAREAADMIVTDDDLATIVDAVREGRSIYDNIRKVVEYLVAANLAEVLVFVVSLLAFAELGVPLLPIQLLWINLLTDGLPALALGSDAPAPGLMDQPPRPRDEPLLYGRRMWRLLGRAALIAIVAIGALVAAKYGADQSWATAQTVLFTAVVFTQALYAFAVRLPDPAAPPASGRASRHAKLPGPTPWTNPRLVGAVTLSLALQVLIVQWPAAHEIFHTVSLDWGLWLLVAVAGAIPGLGLGLIRVMREQRIAKRTS